MHSRFAFGFLLLLFARVARAGDELPPFLPAAAEFPPDVRAEIATVWTDYTLTRTVDGRPARAPLALYRLFVDHPDVTAAAARHLGLARYRVEALGPDRFSADDGAGARGTYQVLLQDDRRRVLLTQGSHEGGILGRIRGASITILSFELGAAAVGAPEVSQRVQTYVRIENRVAAFFARLLLPLFSRYADRKIAETFNVTAEVSEWAGQQPTAFCAWLSGPAGPPAHRNDFGAVLPPCR